MSSSGRRFRSPWFGAPSPVVPFALAICAVFGVARAAHGSHYLVGGSGSDFATIQAAVDANAVTARDSVLVMPGTYAESLLLRANNRSWFLVGLGGADSTTVPSPIQPASGDNYNSGSVLVSGFTWTSWTSTPAGVWLDSCVLLAGGSLGAGCQPSRITNCTIHGRVSISGVTYSLFNGPSVFRRLHFVHAQLRLTSSGCSGTNISDCTFDGSPGETLAVASGNYTDFASFGNCAFSNASYGVVVGSAPVGFGGCRFTGLGTGIYGDPKAPSPGNSLGIAISNSRFEACGTAVRSTGHLMVFGVADTVLNCTGDGVVLAGTHDTGNMQAIKQWIVSACGGAGIRVTGGTTGAAGSTGAQIESTLVADNAGDGLHFAPSDTTMWPATSLLLGCRAQRNQGDGYHVEGERVSVRNCVALGNGSNGFDDVVLPNRSSADRDSLLANTSVDNAGDGFVVSGTPISSRLVLRNISAFNHGAGYRTPSFIGSLAHNDSWSNDAGDYLELPWPADSNLTVNPGFCGWGAGDLTLREDSPCGPTGVYALLGALPVGCASGAGVPPSSALRVLAVRPNPARGSVEFALPLFAGAGTLDVLDLQGRVRWRRAVAAGDRSLRWNGMTPEGPLSPGLYWARLVTSGQQSSLRMIWMR
jgi:hypothetical protein